jgi:hypothetical protein
MKGEGPQVLQRPIQSPDETDWVCARRVESRLIIEREKRHIGGGELLSQRRFT